MIEVLSRSFVEARLRSAWQAQRAAEMEGDEYMAQAMRDVIDRLLDRLATLHP